MDVEIVGKFLSTLPEDDDHPYRTGPWRPQTTEWDADDLAQETFMVLARQGSHFEGRSSVYTWLYGILLNLDRH